MKTYPTKYHMLNTYGLVLLMEINRYSSAVLAIFKNHFVVVLNSQTVIVVRHLMPMLS